MPTARPGVLRRLLAAAAAGALLTSLAGCSYLEWRSARHAKAEQLKKNPADLALAREYAP